MINPDRLNEMITRVQAAVFEEIPEDPEAHDLLDPLMAMTIVMGTLSHRLFPDGCFTREVLLPLVTNPPESVTVVDLASGGGTHGPH